MGQYAQSVESVSRGIELDPKPVRYARGYAYLALGNYSAALADAETGIVLNASYPVTYAVKALALQGMGRNTEALAATDQAFALDPGNAHYWHVKGILLAASGNCTGAQEALERSLEIDPDYTLPWPGFSGARESLASLNSSCIPVTRPSSLPRAKSPVGGMIPVVGVIGAVIAIRMRK
jgi:tetratricopeptide (TPR) repeat protein